MSNRFHHWIPRIEIIKTKSHVDRFDELLFYQKNRTKNIHLAKFFISSRASRGSKTVPLTKETKTKNTFFSQMQIRASCGRKTVVLTKEIKKQKHIFLHICFVYERHVAKANTCPSRKENRSSRQGKKTETHFFREVLLQKQNHASPKKKRTSHEGKKNGKHFFVF